MGSQPKKKDFWNGGRGVNPNDFEGENSTSPPLSPEQITPPSPPILGIHSTSPRPLEFPQTLSASNSPPPVYPISTPYGFYSPPYHSHNPYLPSPLCPPGSSGHYPIPGMPYGTIDINATAQGAMGIATNSFADAHLPRNYGPSAAYPAEIEPRGRERDGEGPTQEKETAHQGATRQQKCSLCYNHGYTREKKGHKWRCEFKNCDCERCLITKGRQKTMRDQQKLTRHLQKMQL